MFKPVNTTMNIAVESDICILCDFPKDLCITCDGFIDQCTHTDS